MWFPSKRGESSFLSGEVITLRPRLVLTNASTLDIELCLGRSMWICRKLGRLRDSLASTEIPDRCLEEHRRLRLAGDQSIEAENAVVCWGLIEASHRCRRSTGAHVKFMSPPTRFFLND